VVASEWPSGQCELGGGCVSNRTQACASNLASSARQRATLGHRASGTQQECRGSKESRDSLEGARRLATVTAAQWAVVVPPGNTSTCCAHTHTHIVVSYAANHSGHNSTTRMSTDNRSSSVSTRTHFTWCPPAAAHWLQLRSATQIQRQLTLRE
jgi:hypothetical protein